MTTEEPLRHGVWYDLTQVSTSTHRWVWVSASPPKEGTCRVYWGSHGCDRPRGHRGPHVCDCAPRRWLWWIDRMVWRLRGWKNVGFPPYYGPDTRFYGEDAEDLGLPLVSARVVQREPGEHDRRTHDNPS